MPIEVQPNEDKGKFLMRCIKKEIGYGKTPQVAAAICYSVWKNRKK